MIPGALFVFLAAQGGDLEPARLEALHRQRVEWMKTRRVDPDHGVYLDLRAAAAPPLILPFRVQELAKKENIQILLTDREPRFHNGVLWFKPDASLQIPPLPSLLAAPPGPRELKRLLTAFKQYPAEFAGLTGGAFSLLKLDASETPLAPVVRHVLARELSDGEVRNSLRENRTYLAEEWLCDTAGFGFWAVNNQGVFEIGDRFPKQSNTSFDVRLPVAARMKLFRDGVVVQESVGASMQAKAPGPGAYHLEVDLEAAGETRRWIRTQPIFMLDAPGPGLPAISFQDAAVTAVLNIPYDDAADPKQKLDLYLPKGKENFPMFVFMHGGGWASGDRGLYGPIGVLLAKRGIGVAIPSYRLMPRNPHPAQVEDAAAAFAWVVKNAKRHGADESRIFLGGHSAGGHLAALIALDKSLLARHGVDAGVIKGVAALSGAYDLAQLPMFGTPEDRAKASPSRHVRRDAPPFLVSYCQWDYLGLPLQAKELALSLKRAFVATRLLYVPGETHITEMIAMLKAGDPTTEGIVRLVETGEP